MVHVEISWRNSILSVGGLWASWIWMLTTFANRHLCTKARKSWKCSILNKIPKQSIVNIHDVTSEEFKLTRKPFAEGEGQFTLSAQNLNRMHQCCVWVPQCIPFQESLCKRERGRTRLHLHARQFYSLCEDRRTPIYFCRWIIPAGKLPVTFPGTFYLCALHRVVMWFWDCHMRDCI